MNKKYLLDKHDRKIYIGDRLSYDSDSSGIKLGTLEDSSFGDPDVVLVSWDDWGSNSVLHYQQFNRESTRKRFTKIDVGGQQPFEFE